MPTRTPPSLDKETNDRYTRLVCSKRAPGELLPLADATLVVAAAELALATSRIGQISSGTEKERERERESVLFLGCMRPMSRSGGSRCRCYHLSQKLIRRDAEPRELARGIC